MITDRLDAENGNIQNAFDDIKDIPIVIDSCVLLYCQGRVFKLEIRKILRLLSDHNNNLKISEISAFEVLKNAQVKNWDYFTRLIDYIGCVDIDTDIIFNSLTLFKSYVHKPINDHQKISSCDFIIGGTVIYIKGLLFTADREHFPSPLWDIVAHTYVAYKLDKYELINLYLLKPNFKLIDELKKKCIEKEL